MLKFTLPLTAAALVLASPVFAMGQLPPRPGGPRGAVHSVPEIDAAAGLLALAAVALLLLLVWERRRHRLKRMSAPLEPHEIATAPRSEATTGQEG